MKIQRLYLRHFRGFVSQEIVFPANGVAVFIGTNGAGKSTVIEVISALLGVFADVALKKQSPKQAVRNHFNSHDIALEQEDANIVAEWQMPNGEISKWELQLKREGASQISKMEVAVQWIAQQLTQHAASVPMAACYAFANKTDKKRSGKEKLQADKRLDALIMPRATLQNFDDFVSWFTANENIENQEIKKQQDFTFELPELATVRAAISCFFSHLQNAAIGNLRIERREEALLFAEKNGKSFPIEQLSAGERMLLLLVADIARKIVVANPALSGDELLQKGLGIVCIDEIEQHLHPQWQRNVITALQKTFPALQLVITTHSPQVISAVAGDSVFILDNFKLIDAPKYTEGRDANSLLAELFNVAKYQPTQAKMLEKIYDLLHEGRYEEVQKNLQTLAGLWGENDLEVKRAQFYLEDSLMNEDP